MRIHSNVLIGGDILDAARIARVSFGGPDSTFTEHGSRSHARAFNVLLTGESRRRPNSGARGAGDEYAATWDQWGVFLAHLFTVDPDMVTPYYRNAIDFANQTGNRFGEPEVVMGDDGYEHEFNAYDWPDDAHGDHSWVVGQPYVQTCRHCSAEKRWGPVSSRTGLTLV